ncbi:protein aar2 like protein [Quercus suber]|uniref:Protein aar2 like protein n=1 Tax=Quercus suber TaxID=58331 RepID=A0AAW0IWM3_QUESU
MWQMFSVGPAFKGIKMIPPASHFLYYSSSTRLLLLSEIFMFFQYGDWKHLSYYIAKSFIERIEPIGGEITVACESGIVTDAPKTAMEKALDEQMKSSKFLTSVDNSQSRRCYYTSIPRVIKQKGIHGQELTSLNIDKTQLLESLLIKDYGGLEDLLLGELQFAFIAFFVCVDLYKTCFMLNLLLGFMDI